MLRLNTIHAQPGATRARKRLGRGTGSGTGEQSTKGHKGQKARKSGHAGPGFEGGQTPLYRKLPKFGFKNIRALSVAQVNVGDLSKCDGIVNLEALRKAGVVKGSFVRLNILGSGELKKSLNVHAHKVTPSAAEKIKKAGGSVELIPAPKSRPRGVKKAIAG